MLPKNRRLTTKDFKEIFDRGRSFRGRYFVLRIALFSGQELSTFGFSIPKKAFKNATDRNLYRRRGYSVISGVIGTIRSPYKCLFTMNKTANKPSFDEVSADIISLLYSAKLIS